MQVSGKGGRVCKVWGAKTEGMAVVWWLIASKPCAARGKDGLNVLIETMRPAKETDLEMRATEASPRDAEERSVA